MLVDGPVVIVMLEKMITALVIAFLVGAAAIREYADGFNRL
jgi:hypothetical protein